MDQASHLDDDDDSSAMSMIPNELLFEIFSYL